MPPSLGLSAAPYLSGLDKLLKPCVPQFLHLNNGEHQAMAGRMQRISVWEAFCTWSVKGRGPTTRFYGTAETRCKWPWLPPGLLSPVSAPSWVWDRGQLTSPLWASVSSPVKWGQPLYLCVMGLSCVFRLPGACEPSTLGSCQGLTFLASFSEIIHSFIHLSNQ